MRFVMIRSCLSMALAGLLCLLAASAQAQVSFELAASPSRFELTGRPSGRIGQTLSLFNVGGSQAEVAVRTLDFTFSESGQIGYQEDLSPASCRPWVTLERRSLRIQPRTRGTLRFQVDVPPGTPRGECRFMLAIEGRDPAYQVRMEGQGAQMSMPVAGRIAVAVYVAVDGARPRLELQEFAMRELDGRRVPALTVRNAGDAHSRLDGVLDAVNADGLRFEVVPDGSPILPGQTRVLPLQVRSEPGRPVPSWSVPLKVKGRVEWTEGSFRVDTELR